MKYLGLLLMLSTLIFACGQDEYISDVDTRLERAIQKASDNVGIAHYVLPNSNELRSIPQDPQNRLTKEKIELGQMLFHENAFSTAGSFEHSKQTYSCATCHHAGGGFQANLPQGIADGGMGFGIAGEARGLHPDSNPNDADVQPLRTPSAMNLAYQTNLLWNGQFGATNLNEGTSDKWIAPPQQVNFMGYEGLETQAIAGFTVHRMEVDSKSVIKNGYKDMWDNAFGHIEESDRYTVERAGQAIAAYERTLLSNQAPFQQWLRGDQFAMTDNQKEGAMLFFGKADCASCHNGPALANMEFHALGMNDFKASEVFNFLQSDEAVRGRASFTKDQDDMYKFKVPQLYNLKDSPFYGHGASFNSVRDVIEYKNEAMHENMYVSEDQLSEHFTPLNLTDTEIDLIVDFVENALYDASLDRYTPQHLPTGMCMPNNDAQSRIDLGCN